MLKNFRKISTVKLRYAKWTMRGRFKSVKLWFSCYFEGRYEGFAFKWMYMRHTKPNEATVTQDTMSGNFNWVKFWVFTSKPIFTILHESFVGPRLHLKWNIGNILERTGIFHTVTEAIAVRPRCHLNWNIVKHSGTYWNISYCNRGNRCETQMPFELKHCETFSNVLEYFIL